MSTTTQPPNIDEDQEAAIRRLTSHENSRIAELAERAIENIEEMQEGSA